MKSIKKPKPKPKPKPKDKEDCGSITATAIVKKHTSTPPTFRHPDTDTATAALSKHVSSGLHRPRLVRPSSKFKLKLQLFPIHETFRIGLEKDGHNPFLELTLSPRKKISSVIKHLSTKWGASTIAIGELMLFPFNTASLDISSSITWTCTHINITAADVHAAIGSPHIFRLSYGWFLSSIHPNRAHVENVCCATTNHSCNTKCESDAGATTNDLETCKHSERSEVAVIPLNQVSHNNQHDDSKPTRSNKTDNDFAVEANCSDAKNKSEETRFDTSNSQMPLLWSDLSNISIGGLLSEASLQGKFKTEDLRSGGSRLVSHSIATDSLDAFIEKFKNPQSSTTLSSDISSSILDAESTCQSFAFSKPLLSSKDLATFRQNAFSSLSDQNAASQPFKCPKSEVTRGAGVLDHNIVQVKTDSLPCSSRVYDNENSLGLSSIKWNDSLGPFDLPLTTRQVIKDDTLSIGGLFR